MKKILFFLIALGSVLLFSENGIVLHPNLSYRASTPEAEILGSHTIGDSVEIISDNVDLGGYIYKVIKRKGETDENLSSTYFIIPNSTEACITDEAYLYTRGDLSTPSNKKLSPLQFIVVDNDTLNDTLVKIHYLEWNGKSWYVKDGFIKNELVSTQRDNWGASIKYFLATQEDSLELRDKTLKSIKKFHKDSLFLPLIEKMINNGTLLVSDEDLDSDQNFAGTDDYMDHVFNITLYKEADITSEVLFEGNTELKINSRSESPLTIHGTTDYMYYVSTKEHSGWIFGLE